uniref:Protein transport protein Sec24A n=1 Tax=Phallusia mammillata TaxID=59560 RepID=A0A6F9DSR9_9ASCI|nr:protein transport protein Sec24A [Phallusia mammillata]
MPGYNQQAGPPKPGYSTNQSNLNAGQATLPNPSYNGTLPAGPNMPPTNSMTRQPGAPFNGPSMPMNHIVTPPTNPNMQPYNAVSVPHSASPSKYQGPQSNMQPLAGPPLPNQQGQNAMPHNGSPGLHGSHTGVTPPASQHGGIGDIRYAPPLPGQQFKSFTPPPGHPPNSHSPGLQAMNQHSSNSTPTHPGVLHPASQGTPTHSIYAPTSTGAPPLMQPPLPGQQTSNYPAMSQPSSMQTGQKGGIIAPPPLSGQQYVPPQNIHPPPPMSGPPTSGPQMSGPPMSGPPMSGPPMPGQPSNQTMAQGRGTMPPPGGEQKMHQQPGQPQQPHQPQVSQPSAFGAYPPQMQNLTNSMGNMGMGDANRPVNLMQETRILPPQKTVELPLRFETNAEGMLIPPNRKNCNPEVLRCTLKRIPDTKDLLGKVKLPFGLVVHPFRDLTSLPVISAGTIVRCKRCRTYINPFVSFLDERRWRCNMCFGVNETPEEFLHHPVTKTYGQPHTRPECTNATIEFIAPQEYMLRPPQPAVYLFLMDVSHSAVESGYLQIVCDALLDNLERLPGDKRTRIGFLTYNGTVHFYRLSEGLAQPQMIVVSDIDDVFLPTPENLLVNLHESKDLVQDLLHQLPTIHNVDAEGEIDTYSALGAALEVAKKLMSPFGGRVTVFQQAIPSIGPGTLKSREDPNSRAGQIPTANLNPATDFYKKMALDCSAHQVAIDMFFFNSQYIDIATLSCSSRFSAGDLHYYPSLHVQHNPMEVERLKNDLERYLTRKIGFEAVMRIRCTKGLSIHTFHGNFFVRSTDLLSLANVSPDSGYAVNLTLDEPLTDQSAACVQAALLYTTSKGERRIRVHTMCIPIVKTTAEIHNNVDCEAVVALLAKMGVDRSVTASLQDARDALLNAVIDPLKAYKAGLPQSMTVGGLYVPKCLRLFPLYIQSLLKHPAFRAGVSTRLDDRVFSMINFKMQPVGYFMQDVHPDLYRVDDLNDEGAVTVGGREVPQPDLLPLSAESISQYGCFLLDCGWRMFLLVGRQSPQAFIKNVLGAPQFSNIEEPMYSIPELENPTSELFHSFIEWLRENRPHHAPIRVIRDDSRDRHLFFSRLHQDRTESSMSLQEFLIHVQQKLT